IAPAPAPAEQAAPEESSVLSPDGSGAATSAPVPDGNEPAASAPIPDAGHGDGAEPEEKPTIMEAVTAPSGDASPDKVEQTEDGKGGLGSVQPSVFVNLREGPASSAPVIGVIAKGTKLSVLDRKRGWVQVADPATGKKGWIYSGLLAGEAKTHHRRKRVAPAEAEPKSESFWSRLGGWLSP
ncbi:MAG TPA: SH3 domain-containing protein, partial [Methyloceanibacter sp.]